MKPTLLLLACGFAAACSPAAHALEFGPAGDSYAVPIHSLRSIRFQQTLRQQYDFSCGSAAVATLLTYQYGVRVTEQEVFDEMFANGDQAKIRVEGFSLLDIKRFLADRAFDADGFEVSLDVLAKERLPAIALIQDQGYHHFVVIKGVDSNRVLLGDPALGVRAMPRRKFESVWANRVLFVIHNHRERAAFNRIEDWRLAPSSPIKESVIRGGLDGLTIFRLGPGEF